MLRPLIALAGAGLLAGACTTTGNTERNAAGGAALGALAGAAIGAVSGDVGVGTGAAVGAAVGGTVGAVKGCREDGGCGASVAEPQAVLRRARGPLLLLRPRDRPVLLGKRLARAD